MAHPLRRLLKRTVRGAAANVNATFAAYSGSGCTVRLRDTGSEVFAKLAISAQIAPGQDVIVARPDGSERSANTGYTVIALAGDSAPGASPQLTQATEYAGATITSIDPDPAIITAGEDVNIAVLGSGFSTVPLFSIAPAYGSERLTNATAPVIADREIDLVVHAAGDIEPGDYFLKLGSLRKVPLYFQVGEAPPAVVHRVLGSRFNGGFRIVDDLTGTQLVESDGSPDFTPGNGSWILRGDDWLFWGQVFLSGGPGFQFTSPVVVSRTDATYALVPASGGQWPRPGGDAANGRWPSHPRFPQFGSTVWYFGKPWNSGRTDVESGSASLFGIDTTTGDQLVVVPPPGTHDFNEFGGVVIRDDTFVYAIQTYQESGNFVQILHKVNTDGSIAASADMGTFSLRNGFAKDGFLYFLYDHFTSASSGVRDFCGILRIVASTLATDFNSELKLVSVATIEEPYCIAHDDAACFIAWTDTASGSNGFVSRVDLTTLNITHETALLTNYAFSFGPYFDHEGQLWVMPGFGGNEATVLAAADLSVVDTFPFTDVDDPLMAMIAI